MTKIVSRFKPLMPNSSGLVRRSYKQAKRGVRKAASAASNRIAEYIPASVKRTLGPPYRYLQMLFLDIGALRLVYPNRHKVADGVWRSAQPLPHHIAGMAKQGIRTVVNLRGVHTSSAYRIEREACRAHGIEMIDFEVRSRAAPTQEELRRIRKLFDTIEYPALIHCKSGSDRAGLMSALYLHLKQGVPIKQAKHQLALRYGHIRHANPGVLSYFFERYLSETEDSTMSFLDWVDTCYDPDEVKASFRSKGWANRLVDDILSRE